MSNLQKAISLAVDAHFNQTRRNGEPYILHPIRVMLKMQTEEQKIVAILHDVIEDTSLTEEDLYLYGFSENVIKAIMLLTKSKDCNYEAYIDFIRRNEIARKVKIEDIKDNLDLEQLDRISEKDIARSQKYIRALAELIEAPKLKHIQKGVEEHTKEN